MLITVEAGFEHRQSSAGPEVLAVKPACLLASVGEIKAQLVEGTQDLSLTLSIIDSSVV